MPLDVLSLSSVLQNRSLKEEDVESFVNYVWDCCRDANDTRRKLLLDEINGVIPFECDQWHQFKIFCESLSSLAECFRYDATTLRSLVCAASTVSIQIGDRNKALGIETSPKVTSMVCLYPLHIWNNIPLWIDMTDNILIQDSGIIDFIYSNCPSNLISKYLFGWKRSELKLIFLCNRIEAVTQSMRAFGLKNDIIDVYVSTIKGRYKMTDYNLDIPDLLLYPLTNEILSGCIGCISKLSAEANYIPTVAVDQFSLQFGYGDIKATSSMGYSTILSMLLLPAYLYINGLLDVSIDKNAPMVRSTNNSQGAKCFCGQPLTSWRMVGMPSNEEMLLQSKLVLINLSVPTPSLPFHVLDRIPSCICEDCYRKSCMHHDVNGHLYNGETNISESIPVSISPCFSSSFPEESKAQWSKLLNTISCVEAEKALHRALRISYKPQSTTLLEDRSISVDSNRDQLRNQTQTKQTNRRQGSEHIQEQMINDDASIVSGFSKMEDDESQIIRSNPKTRNEVQPLTMSDFHQFILDLWNGITITLIYSHNPPIEKTRLLYLRSDKRAHDDDIVRACSSSSNVSDVIKRNNCQLYLGWARQSERGYIVWNPKKSVQMSAIRNIKVGSKKWSNCIKLATDTKIIVIKIEDESEFQRSLRGLTQLLGSIS